MANGKTAGCDLGAFPHAALPTRQPSCDSQHGVMVHSVSGHLRLRVAEYDELIRRLVPAYLAMRPVQLDLPALALPRHGGRVLDLGGGTGALAAAIAERFPTVEVEIW